MDVWTWHLQFTSCPQNFEIPYHVSQSQYGTCRNAISLCQWMLMDYVLQGTISAKTNSIPVSTSNIDVSED